MYFLTGQELADLQEFMKYLTGEIPPNVGPPTTQQTTNPGLLRGPGLQDPLGE